MPSSTEEIIPRTVRSWNEPGALHVAFTDNGIGIAKRTHWQGF